MQDNKTPIEIIEKSQESLGDISSKLKKDAIDQVKDQISSDLEEQTGEIDLPESAESSSSGENDEHINNQKSETANPPNSVGEYNHDQSQGTEKLPSSEKVQPNTTAPVTNENGMSNTGEVEETLDNENESQEQQLEDGTESQEENEQSEDEQDSGDNREDTEGQEGENSDSNKEDNPPEDENESSEDTSKENTANENEAAEPEGTGEAAGETGAEGAGEAGAEAGAEAAGAEAGVGAEAGAAAGAEAGVAGAEGAVAAEAGAAGIAGAEAAGAGAVAGAAAAEGAVAGAAAGAGATAGVAVAWPVIVIIIIVLIIALVIFIIVGYFLPRTHTDKTNPDDMTAITQVEDLAASGKITFSNPDDLSKISAGKIGPASVWMMSSLSKAHESIKINYGNTNYDESTPGVTNQNEPYEFDVESVDSIKCVDTKSNATLSPIPISLKSNFDWSALIKPEYTDQVKCAVGYYPGKDTPIIGTYSSRFGPGIFSITELAQAGRKAVREKTAEIVAEAIDANRKLNEGRKKENQLDISPVRIDISSADKEIINFLSDKIKKFYPEGTDSGVIAKDTLPKGVHISFM